MSNGIVAYIQDLEEENKLLRQRLVEMTEDRNNLPLVTAATVEAAAKRSELTCPKCGGVMGVDMTALLTSKPPKRRAECTGCGHIEFPFA